MALFVMFRAVVWLLSVRRFPPCISAALLAV
jgi:hypothetical protein